MEQNSLQDSPEDKEVLRNYIPQDCLADKLADKPANHI